MKKILRRIDEDNEGQKITGEEKGEKPYTDADAQRSRCRIKPPIREKAGDNSLLENMLKNKKGDGYRDHAGE